MLRAIDEQARVLVYTAMDTELLGCGGGGDGAGVQGEAHVLGHGNKCTCYFHGGKTDS